MIYLYARVITNNLALRLGRDARVARRLQEENWVVFFLTETKRAGHRQMQVKVCK